MHAQDARIEILIEMIVVPVHKIEVLRHFREHVLREARVGRVVAARREQKEHIAPHHRAEPVPRRDLRDAREVAEQNLRPVLETVFREELPEPDTIRFIHADMYPAGGERFLERREHMLDQFIGAVIVDEQNIVRVEKRPEAAPPHEPVEVSERLDTGHEFDTAFRGVSIDLTEFFHCIFAAAVAEIRLLFDLIGVFGVQHERFVAHLREQVNVAFQRREVHDRPAGAVEHDAEPE